MRLRFIFTIAVVFGFSFSNLQAQQTAKISSAGTGYLEYLPQDYTKNTNKYPIVIFLHGIGERGTTSTDPNTLKSSVQKVANVGLAKYIKYGQQYPFIVISPQLKSSYGTWPANYVMEVLNHVKKYLRVDESRIYITGLSLGGFGTWTTLGAYPNVFAAAVPICSGGGPLSRACAIASENVAIWAFHGTGDNVVSYTVTTKLVNAVNACTPKPNPLAKTTLFSGLGHNVWDKTYKETTALNWMLTFRNGTTSGTTNAVPTVNAGGDKTITLPTNETYLQGTASDADGSIASYTWSKLSGGTASLSGTTSSKLRAYNMVAGTYYFRLTVKDDKGASKYDDVKVVVSQSSTTNTPPVANAGTDKTTSSNTITLTGSGTDSDGQIASYNWIKYGGEDVLMTNQNTKAVTINGLRDGRYYFRLTVKDDKGATDYDNMMVTVSGSANADAPTAPNVAPVANAGADRTTSSTSITLGGSATDRDGRIVSYRWTQYGGAATTMTNAATANVTVSGLRDGKYYFRLTVTDGDGATHYDNMLLTVTKSGSTASNLAPVSNAGADKRITTDLSSIRLYGSGYDKDGNIASFKWTQYGGPAISLTNPSSPTVTVSNLREGSYYLRLTVKDNDGAVDYDNMLLVVTES